MKPPNVVLRRWLAMRDSDAQEIPALLSSPEFNACRAHRRFALLRLLQHIRQTATLRSRRIAVHSDNVFVDDAASRVHGVECCDAGTMGASPPPGAFAFGAETTCIVAFTAADDFLHANPAVGTNGAHVALVSVARRLAAVFGRLAAAAASAQANDQDGSGDSVDVYVCGFGAGAALAAATMSLIDPREMTDIRLLGMELYGCPGFCTRGELARFRDQWWWYPMCTLVRCNAASPPRCCVGCAAPDFKAVVLRASETLTTGCATRLLRKFAACFRRDKDKDNDLAEYVSCAAHDAVSCECPAAQKTMRE